MEDRKETIKIFGVVILAVICLSVLVGLTVKFTRGTAADSGNANGSSISADKADNTDNAAKSLTLNKTSYVFLDNVEEGASVGANDSHSVVNLKATVKVSGGLREVEYSYSWYNPQSTWATDKDVTDYIQAYYDDDNPLGVKLVCKKPFGEKIILVATSRADRSLFSQCTIDYGAKVSRVHMIVNGTSEFGRFSLNTNDLYSYKYTNNDYAYYNSVTFDYGVGTIIPTSAGLALDVLPSYAVSDLTTSDFMLKTEDEEVLQYIDRYCKGAQKRNACVKVDGKYKYIDFSSPYMFLTAITGMQAPAESTVKVFADHINGQDWNTDFVKFYYTVYDSLRGSGNRYEVCENLTFLKNEFYVFGSAVTE